MTSLPKFKLDTVENREFAKAMREDLIRFGKQFPSPGGSSYYLGDDGTPWKDRPRETWITSRMVHVYSMAAMLGYDGCEELAQAGLKGLRGELMDKANGGWYAGIGSDGSALANKQCYAHAFVILAACSASLIKLDGAQELLEQALAVYDRYFWEAAAGLAADTWDTEFKTLDDYRGINANMHSVEAFLAVYDTLGRKEYLDRAGSIISHVIKWAGDNDWRIPEHYTKDWVADINCNREKPDDQFKPYGATPGHGFEWARLIMQWAAAEAARSSLISETATPEEYLSCQSIQPYTDAARSLYEKAIAAWNCDGAPGIVYTTDWDGKPVVHDRMHWTLAEAVNTSAVLFRVTGDEQYSADYEQFTEYLDQYVLDHDKGSWFHQLDRNNKVIGTVWPGKSDLYHAFQATLIPYNRRVGVSIAASLKK